MDTRSLLALGLVGAAVYFFAQPSAGATQPAYQHLQDPSRGYHRDPTTGDYVQNCGQDAALGAGIGVTFGGPVGAGIGAAGGCAVGLAVTKWGS